MIHDATGKFSSRCPLPDRNSLAVVISNWLLHLSGQVGLNAAILRAREGIDIAI
jgi:enamine deaminase RidA (YjgF/YER057c/UK114 family)